MQTSLVRDLFVNKWASLVLYAMMFSLAPTLSRAWTYAEDGKITAICFIKRNNLPFNTGWATMTHYDLPLDYLASSYGHGATVLLPPLTKTKILKSIGCGCTARSTHYPTVALSTLGFGSTSAFGPSCGRCFKLTLLHPLYANPPFYPPETKSIVVKVTDRCPGDGLCGATEDGPN
jgi:hypothetical protein